MRFAEFCSLCRALESTQSRLEKIALVADFFGRLAIEEIPWAAAFLSGRPFPVSDPRVLQISWASVAKISAGLVAGEGEAAILDIGAAFARIAEATGKRSRQVKRDLLAELFSKASRAEQQILKRILHGEMRIGFHDGLIEEAVAKAAGVDIRQIRRAALFLSDLGEVARIALSQGATGLGQVRIQVFTPLLPMLSELADNFAEILSAHRGRTALEFKYDGARLQIHKSGDVVRIWSRRLTEVTSSLPDVVALARGLTGESFILDGEVVATGKDHRPLPFQDLMRRFRRVHDIEASVNEIPLALYLFDCLLVDERSLVDEPYETRWAQLETITGGAFLAQKVIVSEEQGAQAFLQRALAQGHEGVMAKDPSSVYEPGSRGKRWFKIKPALTVDCAIVAADWGSGRRRGWLSNYHLAVRDDAGGFAPVGKTFKGLTDQQFAEMTGKLKNLQIQDDGYTVVVRPEVVVEVTYNEIQQSPQYRSGFALRFARITRIREDKGPTQATGLGELRDLYNRQFLSKSRRDL